ncbi:MAG: YiiX/YebB-like N1pC/P60 family cysteine hydrolase [Candidatus Eremiobacteraeota bacterium]|nr:YiiX/YebB-like N1pC/P60 family cysteine hydrolase [Candidatus Eremiobacteraeota bacterium]
MEIGSTGTNPYRGMPREQGQVREQEPQVKDTFERQKPSDEPSGNGNWFTTLLSLRIPSTTEKMSDERRDKICSVIQPGDIILETNNPYPGWQVFEKVTLDSDYTHAAMYEGDGKFIEATTGDPSGKGVVRTDLREYLQGQLLIEVIRPPYKTPEDRQAAVDYLRSQLGKPYDSAFDLSEDKAHYCAEIVYRALQNIPNKIEAPLKNFMGRPAAAPASFQDIKGAETVYSDKSSFWKNMASHYPVLMGAATGAAAGAMFAGPIGATAGFLGGLLLTSLVGNKIQTGHFNLMGDSKSDL